VGDYDNGADYGIGDVVSTPAGSPYGSAGQLFIRVSNPNNPGYPPGTSSWSSVPGPNVFVSGAGVSGANGLYVEAGVLNSKKFYNLQSGGYVIAWESPNWVIRTISSVTLYTSNNNVEFPWQVTTWSRASGIAPVPAAVSSVTPTVDATAMYRGSTKIWPVVDLDAQDYINRVEAADSAALGGTQTLEQGVKDAINAFVIGCKRDGIWGKISNAAILCGARSLQGALCKLTGYSPSAPVSYGFVQSDYSRTLGLLGASSSTAGKYIDTREPVSFTNYEQFPDSSVHAAAFVGNTHNGVIMGSADAPTIAQIGLRPFSTSFAFFRARDSRAVFAASGTFSAGFVMAERQFANDAVWSHHSGATTLTESTAVNLAPYSTTIPNNTVWLFRRNQGGQTTTAAQFSGRILYYSLGRSITDVPSTPAYYFGGSGRSDMDGFAFTGVYKQNGPNSFILQDPDAPDITLALREYDDLTNRQRYVLTALMEAGAEFPWPKTEVYVGMASEPPQSAVDPFLNSVSLLLPMNASFADFSSNNVALTVNGNAAIRTDQTRFGGGAGYFGFSNSYLTASSSSLFGFGTGDFTIEMWIYPQGTTSFQGAFNVGTYANGILIRWHANSVVDSLYINGTYYDWQPATYAPRNTWSHIALVRYGGTVKMFVNGVNRIGSVTNTANIGASGVPVIGASAHDLGQGFNGYIDDLRVTKGVARYTADFTPNSVSGSSFVDPSGPYQRIAGAVSATESVYVTNDQRTLLGSTESIYKARVDALIAGIQGSIV
jgi:hypothetical protein